jgi:mannonate dehydratase
VLDAIRYLRAQKRIFMVDFRNIEGGCLSSEEICPDNGDVDTHRALLAYKEVGYDGPLCPDRVPQSVIDPEGERRFSFCLGYIRGLLQAAVLRPSEYP